jgi:hypothetical protein
LDGWMDCFVFLLWWMDGWMDGWIIFPLVYYYYYYYCYFHFVLITSVQARQTFSFAFLVMPSSECLCQKPTPFDEWMKEGKGREGKGRKEAGGGFVLFWSFQGAAAVSVCTPPESLFWLVRSSVLPSYYSPLCTLSPVFP